MKRTTPTSRSAAGQTLAARSRLRDCGMFVLGLSMAVLITVGVVARPAAAAPDSTPTLDEITIEGEIAMPQVLFITAREPFRYRDTHHETYLPKAEAHLQWVPFPLSIWIVGHERPSTLGTPQGRLGSDKAIEDQG